MAMQLGANHSSYLDLNKVPSAAIGTEPSKGEEPLFFDEDGVEDGSQVEKVLHISEHNMDWLLSQLGSPGRFQVLSSMALLSCMFPVIFNDLSAIFFTISPINSSCLTSHLQNPDELVLMQIDQPTGSCEELLKNNSKDSCWRSLQHQFQESDLRTIVSEWNLICDDYWMVSLTTTIYFLGVMCGSLVFGHLADRFGRKKCILLCYICYLPLATALAFTQHYWLFLLLRYWIGFFVQGIQSVCFVLVIEFCSPKSREILGGLDGVLASFAEMVLTGVVYFGRRWRYIQIALVVPTFLALSKFFLIHESLRWQLVHGKISAAKANILSVLRWNRMPPNARLDSCIDKMSHDLQMEERLESTYSWIDCFRTPRMRRYTIAQSFMWFTLLFVYYGISFSLNEFEGSIYINLAVSAAAELPASFLATWLMHRFGRKKPLLAYFGASGCLCLIVAVMTFAYQHSSDHFEVNTLRTALVLFAKFWLAGAFAVNYVYASELFPTVIRNTTFGICICCHTFGGVAAPQVLLLGHSIHAAVPFAVFGSCCIVSAFLVLIQPETLHQRMPDTIVQVESVNFN